MTDQHTSPEAPDESSIFKLLPEISDETIQAFCREVQEEAERMGLVVFLVAGTPLGASMAMHSPDWYLIGGKNDSDMELGPCRLTPQYLTREGGAECAAATLGLNLNLIDLMRQLVDQLKGASAWLPMAVMESLQEAQGWEGATGGQMEAAAVSSDDQAN